MTEGRDNELLEDLAAQVLSRGQQVPAEQLSAFRVSLARMEGKLDAALSLRREFEAHEKITNAEIVALKLAVESLKGFRGVTLWVAGVGATLFTGGVIALVTFLINFLSSRGPA